MPTLEQLRYRHPEHQQHCSHWDKLSAMLCGGVQMTTEIKMSLLPNPDGRPEAVQRERAELATYINKIGPVLTRFTAQLFSKPLTFEGSKDRYWAEEFFLKGALLDGDDDARAGFPALLRQAMFHGLATGKAIAQVDTRISSGAAPDEASQRNLGELDPYVVLHPRSALWDWDSDGNGFTFTKLHQFKMVRQRWDQPSIPRHTFTIFQRNSDGSITVSKYHITKRLKDREKPPTGPLKLDLLKETDVVIEAVLEDQPIFNYPAGNFKFPILTLTLPDPLWLGDQLFEPQKSYFCQTAALEWALYTTNYASPVVSGVDEPEDDPLQNQKMGDGYYITLKSGQSLSWTERPGGGIGTALNYRNEIQRDIYNVLQQIAIAATDGASIIARSGESKREDRRPEQLLLELYGLRVKEFAQQILDVAAIVRAEATTWQASGMDNFLGEGLIEYIADLQGTQGLNIPSPTFKRESAKHFVRRAGQAMSFEPAAIKQSIEELDAAKAEDFSPQPPPAAAAPVA